MKKLLVILLISIFYISISFGNNNIKIEGKTELELTTQLILSKNILNKTLKGKKYIYKIDLLSKKISKQQIELIVGKLKKININSLKYKKYKNILLYLESKLYLKLFKYNISLKNTGPVVSNKEDCISKRLNPLTKKFDSNTRLYSKYFSNNNLYYVIATKLNNSDWNIVASDININLTLIKVSCNTGKDSIIYSKKGPMWVSDNIGMSPNTDYNKIIIIGLYNNKLFFSLNGESGKGVFRSNYLYDFGLKKVVKLNNEGFLKKVKEGKEGIYMLYRYPMKNNKLVFISKNNKDYIIYEDNNGSAPVDEYLPENYLILYDFEIFQNNKIKLYLNKGTGTNKIEKVEKILKNKYKIKKHIKV